jgi:hypothetical protein
MVDKTLKHNAAGSFRRAFFFKHSGRRYVLKVDKRKDEVGSDWGCEATVKRWNEFRDKPAGKHLAPVLMHGKTAGYFWVVMPKLQTVTSMGVTDYYEFRSKHIEPLIPKIPGKVSGDFHDMNWGMTNRGKWLLLDY